jgi:hypothetical protein
VCKYPANSGFAHTDRNRKKIVEGYCDKGAVKKKRNSNGKGCFLLTKYRGKKMLHAVLHTVGKK